MIRESKVDWLTILMYLVIVVMGWANLYSTGMEEDPSIINLGTFHGKQAIWILGSIGFGILILLLDTKFLEITSYFFYGLTILALVAVLFMKSVSGASSWFAVGGFKLQPTEFAKIATIMALSKYMSRYNFNLYRGWDLMVAAGIVLLPAGLVILQNDAGSALVFFALIFVFYREGMSPLILVILFLSALFGVVSIIWGTMLGVKIALSVVALLIVGFSFQFLAKGKLLRLHLIAVAYLLIIAWLPNYVVKPHHTARLRVLVASEEEIKNDKDLDAVYYNLRGSLVAIGSGGFFGKGFGNATHTRGDFVPEEHTDYIHCVIGEEHGFLGSGFMIVFMMLFIARIIYLAENSKTMYARVLGYGIASVIFFHMFINVGMTLGLMPTVGIPLPFFSYGGSSVITFSMMIFIMMNHYSYRRNILK